MINIVRQIPEEEWRYFLYNQNSATLYHTPEWKTFLETTFDYKSRYLFAIDESGRMIGILPLIQVNSKLTGNRYCALPFSNECGCLGDSAVCSALIDEAVSATNRNHIQRIEIRKAVDHNYFHKKNQFSTYILPLDHDAKKIWSRLHRKSVRWSVKKAEKIGVSVSSSTDTEDLKDFYNLNCITKHGLGVPCHPWIFFKNLFSFLNGHVQIYISRYGDEIIGGGIMLNYRDTVLYGYGAANPKYLNHYPYNAFIWKSIEDACVNKYQCYDFGRSSYDNPGLIQFKKRWGTYEKKLFYSYSLPYTNIVGENRISPLYRLSNSVIRLMPMSFYKLFSTSVFSHLG